MDKVRKLILARINERHTNLKDVSEKLGKNHAYLQQFIHRGVPRDLPEKVRGALAELLDLDEASLGGPVIQRSKKRDVDQGDLFALRELDLRAGAAFSGGLDLGEGRQPAPGGSSIYSHPTDRHWQLPVAFARQELALSPGRADILPVRGDSMDDGTSKGLISGDRVIVDLTDIDARQGAIFAVWDGGGVIIKQVEIERGSEPLAIVCTSLNVRYKPIRLVLDGDVHLIGRVAAKISRM